MMFRVGLDIGGTFSDLAVSTGQSEVVEFKSLTTYDSVESVGECLRKAAAYFGRSLEDFLAEIDLFCFGSTHALNTLLTETGSPVGVITTKGHHDTYALAEMNRGGYHDIREASEKAFKPLVTSQCIREVPERVDYTGRIIVPLDEQALRAEIHSLIEIEKVESLVISFLWSPKNSAHEVRAREIAFELYPDLHITLGSDISGTLGEFKRLTTGIINSYIGKRVDEQATELASYLEYRGLNVPVLAMQTVGGVAQLKEIAKRPVNLLNSGPVGGTVGAKAIAAHLEASNVVCIDMGGTSLDVSQLIDGEMQLNHGFVMRDHPIAISGVDIASVGAGGGSIATVESAGGFARLRVGPESAGSRPGPACYGRGGHKPTVTDANLILGILNVETPLGGEIELDLGAATKAVNEHVAEPLGQRTEEAAWGVYRVVTAQMADAIEDLLVTNGVDPRKFDLMAFGAAGPAHASAIAEMLGIKAVIIPAFFPVFSAFGLMMTDIRHAYNLTDDSVRIPLDHSNSEDLNEQAAYVASKLREVSRIPLSMLEQDRVPEEDRALELTIDLRYSGQELQLAISVPADVVSSGEMSGALLADLVKQWQEKYVRVYGEGAVWSEGHLEVINYRAVGSGAIESPKLDGSEDGVEESEPTTRRIYLGEWLEAQVHHADSISPDEILFGPAVIESELTTVLLRPGDVASSDTLGNLMITCGASSTNSMPAEEVANVN
jgi:N-methylhydantoinase A